MITVVKTDTNGRRTGYTTDERIHIDREFTKDPSLTRLELSIRNEEGTLDLRFDRSQFQL